MDLLNKFCKDIKLTAPSTINKAEDSNTVPYVIGDDDDSDSDGLVDIDEDELFDVQEEKKPKDDPIKSDSNASESAKTPTNNITKH